MKKLKVILLLVLLISTTACKQNITEELHILTTIYPLAYITNEIYNQKDITSIYPEGVDINSYSLTDKQITEYSKNNIFIYNGLSNELNVAKNLINKNNKIRIIDVAYGLNFDNGIEELWLSPNYYLMLATTIKNNLQEFTKSKYINEEITKNYQKLEETLSMMDADLRKIAKSANDLNKGTLIVSSNMFKYLNNYGFNVISLEDEENLTPTNLNALKNNFKDGLYTTIFIKDTEEKTDLIKNLEKDYNAKVVKVNTMTTLSNESKNNNENYLTIMDNYLTDIKNATLGE